MALSKNQVEPNFTRQKNLFYDDFFKKKIFFSISGGRAPQFSEILFYFGTTTERIACNGTF